MHATKDDVFAVGLGGNLREPVRISAKIGELNDFIALVMVPKNRYAAAQFCPCRGDAHIHGFIWLDEIVFERTDCCWCCCSHVVFRLQSQRLPIAWNGDVESTVWLQ